MELIRGVYNLRPRHRGGMVTVGNYDGVHLGHREVLCGLIDRARAAQVPATVMCFEPTPREFFVPHQAPPRLTRFREKAQLLAATGIDQLLCVRFDRELAEMDPEAFAGGLLGRELGARLVVVGDDFRYGRERAGDYASLVVAGARYGFEVQPTATVTLDGERVSSSAVRRALVDGNLEHARRLLGRPYSMSGRVIEGERLGRRIGFPTINIAPKRRVLAVHGVYAVRVRGVGPDGRGEASGGTRPGSGADAHPADDVPGWPGVASVGTRPTVQGRGALLEVHLFDFDGDLYGRHVCVDFLARLRDELTFPDLDAMVIQMHRDAGEARRILGSPC